MERLRRKVNGQKLWVFLDETTDVEQRIVFNFVFGILGVVDERDKVYLLNIAESHAANSSTTAVFFNNSLALLYPNVLYFTLFSLVVSFK